MAYALEHPSHPTDVRMRCYATIGTQTDPEVTGGVPPCNVEQAAQRVLVTHTRAGLPRHSEVERRAETRRLRREQRLERRQAHRQERQREVVDPESGPPEPRRWRME